MDTPHPIYRGKRIRKVLRVADKKTAQQVANRYMTELLEKGDALPPGQRRGSVFGEAAMQYLKEESVRKSAGSQWQDKKSFENFFTVVGNVYLDEILSGDISRFINSLSDSGLKAASVNRALNSLKAFFSWAHRNELIRTNLSTQCRHIKGPQRTCRPLSSEKVHPLLPQMLPNLKMATLLSGVLGLRRGETVNLKWSNINWERCEILIGSDGEFSTKSGAAKVVYPTEELLTELREYRVSTANTTPWVFPNRDRTGPQKAASISRQWRRICDRVGVTDAKFHDLRSTAGTAYAEFGNSDAVVGKLLGHKSPNMARMYSQGVQTTRMRETSAAAHTSFLRLLNAPEERQDHGRMRTIDRVDAEQVAESIVLIK